MGTATLRYREETSFGGYLGLRLLLGRGFSAGIQGQHRSRYSFGVSLNKSF
jgi:hypothetical protein